KRARATDRSGRCRARPLDARPQPGGSCVGRGGPAVGILTFGDPDAPEPPRVGPKDGLAGVVAGVEDCTGGEGGAWGMDGRPEGVAGAGLVCGLVPGGLCGLCGPTVMILLWSVSATPPQPEPRRRRLGLRPGCSVVRPLTRCGWAIESRGSGPAEKG